ncbi:MAG: hypothetical protein JNM22_12135 [Saprospiraceae bacterium]|nr:hypothetical protein [Saprospiraceae bacterium]
MLNKIIRILKTVFTSFLNGISLGQLFFVCLLFPDRAFAQIDWALCSNFVSATEAGGANLGLADPIVLDIQQDGMGRMWFATQRGVSRYDGKRFKSYLNTPSDSLLWQNWGCHFLAADATGRIWLATTYKLFYFDTKEDQFVEYDLSNVEPNATKDTWQSEVYLSDIKQEGGIVFRKNEGLYTVRAHSMTLQKIMVISGAYRSVSGILGRDNEGLFWAGGWSTKEICLYSPNGKIRQRTVAPSKNLRDIFQDAYTGKVWVSAAVLYSFDKKNGIWEQWSDNKAGLLEGLTLVPKLTGDSILWMFPFNQSILLGFNLRQQRFAWQKSTTISLTSPLGCGGIRCRFVDAAGNIWLGGQKGVSVIFTSSSQKFVWSHLAENENTSKKLSRSYISGTWQMPDGSIAEWANDGGFYAYIALSKFSKAYFEGYKNKYGIIGKRILFDAQTGLRTISNITYAFDSSGRCTEYVEGYSHPSVLLEYPLTKSKIVVFRGNKFDTNADISGTWVNENGITTYFYHDGDMAIAISPQHYLKLKKEKPNQWKGIQIRSHGDCRTEMMVQLKRVNEDSIHVNWTALDNHCDLRKGEQIEDVIKRYRIPTIYDSIYISGFRIFNEYQPVTPSDYADKPFIIQHKQNFIAFDFTCSAFPRLCTFYYMLEGFDQGWFVAKGSRTATYTNLDGGNYCFKVKAIDAEGNEVSKSTRFYLKVRPPYYLTWWFIICTTLLITSFIYLLFRYRLRLQLEKESIRQRIARDLHDEVGSTLASISILSESGLRQVTLEGDQAWLSGIGEKARTAMLSMGDIVWAVNPQNDSMDKVVERMIRFAVEMLEPAQITPVFEIESSIYDLKMHMEQRTDFYLFFKESVTNVAKHSKATCVRCSMKKEGGFLHFVLEDNGKGLHEQTQGSLGGNGWRNMQARAKALQAILVRKNGEDGGCEISLKIPTT